MAKGNGQAEAPMVSVPDLRELLGQWQSASAQVAQGSTGVARELVGTGLHWMVQGAEGARAWAQALDASARHWSDMARTAEHKLRTIEDLAGLWNLELDVAGHGAETGVDWGQQVWAEQMQAWSALAQDNAVQVGRMMQAWTEAGQHAARSVDSSAAAGSTPAPRRPRPAMTRPRSGRAAPRANAGAIDDAGGGGR